MPTPRASGGGRPALGRRFRSGLALGLILVAACGGTADPGSRPAIGLRAGGSTTTPSGTAATPKPMSAPAQATPSRKSADGFRSITTMRVVAAPTRVRIPAIGVDARVVPLGRLADGTIAVPARWGDVGWYDRGPHPGEPGPAVLLGHVDSTAGPAVFYRLPALRSPEVVEVGGADGSTTRFQIVRVARYPKSHFPAEAVYLPTLQPLLQLITCGGTFDYRTGHYRDNYVVTATLLGTSKPGAGPRRSR